MKDKRPNRKLPGGYVVEYERMNEVILNGRRILLTYFTDIAPSKVAALITRAMKALEKNP